MIPKHVKCAQKFNIYPKKFGIERDYFPPIQILLMEIRLGPSLFCLRLPNYPFGPLEQKTSLPFVLVYVPKIIEP